MGSGGTCRGLAGQDGVFSKGLHAPKLFSELKMRKVIAGDRRSSANTNTKQFCLMQDLCTLHQFLKTGVLYPCERSSP